MSQEPTAVSSKVWVELRRDADDAILNLRKDSPSNRRMKFEKLQTSVRENPAVRDVYKLSRYFLAFDDEFLASRFPGALVASLSSCVGSNDVEFMRTAYTAGAINGIGGDWKSLGMVLLARFPDDDQLKMAVVRDCWIGPFKSWSQIEVGIALNEDLAKRKIWPKRFNVREHRAYLWVYAYNQTKRRSHLENCIKALKDFRDNNLDAKRRAITTETIAEYEGYLREGKYVKG